MRRLVSIVGFTLACGGSVEEPKGGERQDAAGVERFVVASSWDTLAMVGGTLQDTVLGDPWRIAADEDAVYVYDHALQRLLAIGHDGDIRWIVGSKGSGPGEFEAVRDLEILEDEILLLDQQNGRITIYGKDGEYRSGVRFERAGYVHEMAALPDGRIVAFTGDSAAPIAILDRSGAVLERGSMPVPLPAHAYMAAQGKAVSFPGEDLWVYAFSMGPGWLGFQGTQSLTDLRPYLEEIDFPELKIEEFERDEGRATSIGFSGDPLFAAHDVVLRDSLLYVRFGGRSRAAGRVIDRYRFHDGAYAGTWLLPGRPGRFALAGDRIAVLYGDPYPTLVWLAARESLAFEPR